MSPLDKFFSYGNKFDMKTKADWDFYLLCIMFFAFFMIFADNMYQFFNNQRFSNLGWSIVMIAILYFQYFGLKSAYEFRKLVKKPKEQEVSAQEMKELFK